MLKIAVCDDDPLHCEEIQYKVEKCLAGESNEITVFQSGQTLMRAIKADTHALQIVLLDIQLNNDENGILLAQQINQLNSDIQIIFITGQLQWVSKAGRAENVYLALKPIEEEDLFHALQKAKNKLTNAKINIRLKDSNQLLNQADILYVERRLRTSLFFLSSIAEPIRIGKPLDQILELLDRRLFCRCHNSFIINLSCVCSMKPFEFILSNNASVPISRQYNTDAKNAYVDYMGGLL